MPKDVETSRLYKMGAKRLPVPSQFTPRSSQELTDNIQLYNALVSSFKDVFLWQKNEVSLC